MDSKQVKLNFIEITCEFIKEFHMPRVSSNMYLFSLLGKNNPLPQQKIVEHLPPPYEPKPKVKVALMMVEDFSSPVQESSS